MNDYEFALLIRVYKNLLIGPTTIASIYQWLESDSGEQMNVKGLDSVSGLPRQDVIDRSYFKGVL